MGGSRALDAKVFPCLFSSLYLYFFPPRIIDSSSTTHLPSSPPSSSPAAYAAAVGSAAAAAAAAAWCVGPRSLPSAVPLAPPVFVFPPLPSQVDKTRPPPPGGCCLGCGFPRCTCLTYHVRLDSVGFESIRSVAKVRNRSPSNSPVAVCVCICVYMKDRLVKLHKYGGVLPYFLR